MNTLEIFLKGYNSACTRKNYKCAITQMLDFVNKDVTEVTRLDLTNWLNYVKEKYSTASEALKVNAVKSYFAFLFDNEIIEKNVADKLKAEKIINKPKEGLSKEDALKMLHNAKGFRNKAVIAVFISTGLRVQELIDLQLNDYLNDCLVVKTKGGKYRKILLNNDCKNYINDYLKYRVDGCSNLFTSNRGTKLSADTLRRMLKTLSKKCGIEMNVTNHTFRSTFVTEIAKEHGIVIAQQAVGHSNIATTQRYVRGLEEEVKNVVTNISL